VWPAARNGSSATAGGANCIRSKLIGRHHHCDGAARSGAAPPQAARPTVLQVHDELVLDAPDALDTVLATVETVDGERLFASAFPWWSDTGWGAN